MKTWHLLLIGGVLFYLWSRRKEQQETSATPQPEQVVGTPSSTVGQEATSRPPLPNPFVSTISTGLNVGAFARVGMAKFATLWPPIHIEKATAWRA